MQAFSANLLAWFDNNKRSLPWRIRPVNPYYTWLSEIMLQQTTVSTVIPYFNAFVTKWPSLEELACASLDEVLVSWQGLGYYSRARNLHKCAKLLTSSFPSTEKDLRSFPGIGPYTAAAISSIAFNEKVPAVDGNVVRVLSRYLALPSSHSPQEIREKLYPLLPEIRCGDFTEALMELGALICRPKAPSCLVCPLHQTCKAYELGKVESFPIKPLKPKIPTRSTTAFVLTRQDGAILLRKRPLQGLLAGMMEVPTTPWQEGRHPDKVYSIRHTFTHFHLEVKVEFVQNAASSEGIWVHPRDLNQHPLPTLMKKILRHAFCKENL